MADFGLQGLPPDAEGEDRLSRYRGVLEMLPAEFTTVWIEDHLQLPPSSRILRAAAGPRSRFGSSSK